MFTLCLIENTSYVREALLFCPVTWRSTFAVQLQGIGAHLQQVLNNVLLAKLCSSMKWCSKAKWLALDICLKLRFVLDLVD